jgi:hypothetical protein
MDLLDNTKGGYRFLTGIAPYSAGVITMPGYEIVRATLQRPLPYLAGFELVDQFLTALERPRAALCAVELRLPQPLSFAGFAEFNADYQALLAEWDLLVAERNPIARTNIAPVLAAPETPSLYAFSYTIPCEITDATFIIAGAGDLNDQANLSAAAVVRPGETTPEALRQKAITVMDVMTARLTGLGIDWESATTVDIYTTHPMESFLTDVILAPMGHTAIHGIHWFFSHPPIEDLVFEMDLRGVRIEIRVP